MTPIMQRFFERAWLDYKDRVPDAQKIEQFLLDRSEKIVNDHIALRTLNFPGATKEDLARFFVEQGYEIKQFYEFKEKRLEALHLEGPQGSDWPKIFISELLVEQMNEQVQKVLSSLRSACLQFSGLEQFLSARSWTPLYKDYLLCGQSSEYASWFYAHGWVVNHFTVSVNHLKSFTNLKELNDSLEQMGCVLNASGGKIKGNPSELLEQSSTMAASAALLFEEGSFETPTSYYEFALRYPDRDGELFQGFIPASADKIFESTHQKKR